MSTMLPHIPRADDITIVGPDSRGRVTCTFYAFNTSIALQVYTADTAAAESACRAAVDRCRRWENLLSRFLPESDITHLNNAQGKRVRIAQETHYVLRGSLAYCQASQGAFDITMGAVCALWDFANQTIPRREDVDAALEHVDWTKVQVGCDNDGCWARIDDPAASVDVGGTAKGFIADDLRALMEARGMASGIINLGGNAVVFGSRSDGKPWNVGIRDPFDPTRTLCAVQIAAGSVVTSGPYERCFVRDGVRYHHILSPRTGFPVQTDLASASIISEKSADGDGYSTTLFALGSQRAFDLVRSLPGIEALLVRQDGKILYTNS